MIKALSFLIVFICFTSYGQSLQQEINQQVWTSFIESFNNNDADGFMAVHSKDLTRSPRDAKAVLNWQQYYDGTKKSDDNDRKEKRKRNIELRFIERLASENQAIETGIYKTSYIMANGLTSNYYGKFLVVHRKENGVWKILVDTDSSEGGTINEQSFNAAKPLK